LKAIQQTAAVILGVTSPPEEGGRSNWAANRHPHEIAQPSLECGLTLLMMQQIPDAATECGCQEEQHEKQYWA
jgi:hypothetical protein